MSTGLSVLSRNSTIIKVYYYSSFVSCSISWILTILLFYAIFTKSKEIGSFKWLILNHAIWVIAEETLIALVKPIMISPYLAAYQAGILSKTGIHSTLISGFLFATMLFNIIIAMAMIVFSRYTVLFISKWQRIFKNKCVIFIIVFFHVIFSGIMFFYYLPLINRSPDQFRIEAIDQNPEFAYFMNESTFFFVDFKKYQYVFQLCVLGIIILYVGCFILLGVFLHELRKNHQANYITDEIQRSLLIMAMVQLFTTSTFFLGFPLAFLTFLAFNIKNTAIPASVILIIECTYCPFDIATTLYFVVPYRRFVAETIFRRKKKDTSIPVSIISNRLNTTKKSVRRFNK